MIQSNLTRDPIDLTALLAALRDERAGAVASFLGVVRAEQSADGRKLTALEYEAYEAMALEQMNALCAQAARDHEILAAVIVHRLGRVPLGEASVAVAAAAAHRAAALDACRSLIDRLKADLPIWKKDVWSDGSTTWSAANSE